MRTAVGKELDDLDLLPGIDGVRNLQPRVLLALDQLRGDRAGQRNRREDANDLQYETLHCCSRQEFWDPIVT